MAPRTEDRRESLGWHLDKKVPLGLIFAACIQAAGFVGAYYQIQQDLALLKADNLVLHQRDNKTEGDLRAAIDDVRQQFGRIDAKLDRLIERQK